MIYFYVAATIGLLLVNSLGPGLFFIRYLRWRPLETLCSSVALSFFLLYLATFAIYIVRFPSSWAYLPSIAAAAATVLCAGDLRRLWRNRETRHTMLAFLALVVWLLLLLLLVRNYSGARWFGDWYEHYERATFFSEHKPLDTKFLGGLYLLPARPPMMNLLAASVFWQVTPTFEVFQVVFSYLNALVILPCALIAPSLVRGTRNRAWLIAGFLALSPMFLQNATFTWTKAFTAFYVLTALGLYLSAWRKNDAGRTIAAFACLAIGMLIHYSVAPVIVFLVSHYLLCLVRHRKHPWRELIGSAAVSLAIFATWFAWSSNAYGWKDTFSSNTAVTASQNLSWSENLSKIATNIFNSVVPFFLRGPFEADLAVNPQYPPRYLAYLRDWCFASFQAPLPTMLGLGGLMLVIWLVAKLYLRPPNDSWQHRRAFWLCFVVIVTIVGIAVHGEPDFFGVAHICLQPLVLLGVTMAAVGLPHVPRWFRELALVALLIDAGLGIVLHFYLLHIDFAIARDGDQIHIEHMEMGMTAINNGVLKFDSHLTFLGDHAAPFADFVLIGIVLGVLAIRHGLWLLGERSALAHATCPCDSH